MSTRVAIAVDFGGTKVEAALVAADGSIVEESRFRAPTGPTATGGDLETAVREVVLRAIDRRPSGATVVGAGVGSAGPIDRVEGLVSPLNVPAWREYPLRRFVTELVAESLGDLPVRLETDGVAITLAEHWVGAAQGVDNMMGMVISTGIGGGLILGGRVVTGPTGNAGHIGHVEVGGMTGENAFGRVSSLEAIASGPNAVAWARSEGFDGASGEDLAAAYGRGDPIARATLVRTGTAVGHAIATATALLDLELVTIGGGFSESTPDLFDVVRKTVAGHYFDFVRKVRIVPSALSGAGPLIGAAALVHRADVLP